MEGLCDGWDPKRCLDNEISFASLQGTDPGTDFRGAGIHGLECLLYLSSKHRHLFQRLLLKNVGQRVAWEYPFAVAGLNLTFMLSEALDLGRAKVGAGMLRVYRLYRPG